MGLKNPKSLAQKLVHGSANHRHFRLTFSQKAITENTNERVTTPSNNSRHIKSLTQSRIADFGQTGFAMNRRVRRKLMGSKSRKSSKLVSPVKSIVVSAIALQQTNNTKKRSPLISIKKRSPKISTLSPHKRSPQDIYS